MGKARLIALVLLLAAAGLVFDLRYEHAGAVESHKWAALPPMFCISLWCFGLPTWLCWHTGGRQALFWIFTLCFAVAAFGLWLHSRGDPIGAMTTVLKAQGIPDGPPPLAPGMFALIGLIGCICTWKKE